MTTVSYHTPTTDSTLAIPTLTIVRDNRTVVISWVTPYCIAVNVDGAVTQCRGPIALSVFLEGLFTPPPADAAFCAACGESSTDELCPACASASLRTLNLHASTRIINAYDSANWERDFVARFGATPLYPERASVAAASDEGRQENVIKVSDEAEDIAALRKQNAALNQWMNSTLTKPEQTTTRIFKCGRKWSSEKGGLVPDGDWRELAFSRWTAARAYFTTRDGREWYQSKPDIVTALRWGCMRIEGDAPEWARVAK